MYTIGLILKDLREDRGISVNSVQEKSGIDATLLSRIENGRRLPTLQQISQLSQIYNVDEQQLIVQRESDRIVKSIEYPEIAEETLRAAEAKVRYGEQYMSLFQEIIYPSTIKLESRRYIGSKAKLTDWILTTILSETEDVKSFLRYFRRYGYGV